MKKIKTILKYFLFCFVSYKNRLNTFRFCFEFQLIKFNFELCLQKTTLD